MSDFCLLVTSRGRPDNWARLANAIEETTASGSLDVWLILDEDDPTADDYLPLADATIHIGPRLGHIQSLNAYARPAADPFGYRIVGQCGDDHLPRTKGWDEKIAAALQTTGIAYGNDLFQGANLPTAVFFTSDIIRATGRFAPEGLWHLYADNYWRDLGLGAGCLRYLPDVILEHMHPHAGKSEMDQTYVESIASEVDEKDAAVWGEFQRDELPGDIEKVKALL